LERVFVSGGWRLTDLWRRIPVAKKKTSKAKAEKGKGKGRNNLAQAPIGSGAAMNEQDPKRRLGNFAGAGEHPRQGGRTSGIVGQTKQRTRTDKKKAKKK
jgi:hypothetical protein